jgi:hypothetical protein
VVGWLQEGLAWWYWHLAPYEHTHLSGTMCKSGTRINKDWVASRQWQNSQYSPFKHGTFAQYPDQSKTISTSQVSSLKEINDITNNICSHRHVYTKLHMIQSEELIQNWFQLEKGGGTDFEYLLDMARPRETLDRFERTWEMTILAEWRMYID